ncbi:sensor histidine kinase [Nocardioides sp. SYSU DS0651]|uniref:sensor histidine kinase n=1 Tax=Nocardioides sp. SYSU DS0651 TaxID=3415955 RepID=UPI003F4BFDA8
MEQGDDPYSLLRSEHAVDRLRGARALLEDPKDVDIGLLRDLRAREVDSWVQGALDRVIRTATQPRMNASDTDGWTPPDLQLNDDIRAEAIQSVSRVLLHELRPLVSGVFRATRELAGDRFVGSRSEAAISRLQDFLTTMHRLHDAAAPPNVVQFDLVELLNHEVSAGAVSASKVVVARSDTLVVLGDPELLRFAVQNCLRNAVEASLEDSDPVVLTCGSNQFETWVAILDDGIGLPQDKERLFEPGISLKSKEENFGMGLAIALRAMKSFGGYIELTPREFGGTACELRWPRESAAV